jgi:3-methylfumaryl-CoA hydratase
LVSGERKAPDTSDMEFDASIFDESLSLSLVRRVAAMLDLDPEGFTRGQPLPRGWHFVLMASTTRKSEIRPDGYSGLGIALPDLGLPRLLLGGRTVRYLADLVIGDTIERRSSVESVVRKGEGEKAMAIVGVRHELFRVEPGATVASGAAPAIVEQQEYVLLPASRYQAIERPQLPVVGAHLATVVPDATMLFQYSALGFNSHRIHLDRPYARDVEGYPDLVVNGGLSTLLLTEFARVDLGLTITSLKVRNRSPLFCDRPVTFAAEPVGAGWEMKVHDDLGGIAATAQVETL